MIRYDNSLLKETFKAFLRSKLNQFSGSHRPTLAVIQIGENLASTKYVGLKQKIATTLGIETKIFHFQKNPSYFEIQNILTQAKNNRWGLIFQLPVPQDLQELVLETPLECDIDLLSLNNYKLWQMGFLPPTVGAIDLILKDMLTGKDEQLNQVRFDKIKFTEFLQQKPNLVGKNCAVIGQGVLVGSPLAKYLLQLETTLISVNVNTKNPNELVKMADIVFCGAGKPNLVNQDWLKSKALIIDAATSENNGVLAGDVDMQTMPTETFVCPSPGGVGPLTVLYLFYNLLRIREVEF